MEQIFKNKLSEEQTSFLKDAIKNSIRVEHTKEIKPTFKCRLCGCTEYEGVYGNTSMITLGGRQYPSVYQCSDCSVIFKDPIKFTKVN